MMNTLVTGLSPGSMAGRVGTPQQKRDVAGTLHTPAPQRFTTTTTSPGQVGKKRFRWVAGLVILPYTCACC